MAVSNADAAKTALAKRQQSQAATPEKKGGFATVESMLMKYEHEITAALPSHIVGQQFLRLILQEFRINPKLIACTPESIMGCVMTCARLGLEPGPLGLAYIVPYNKNVKVGGEWKSIPEAQFQGGYRGYVQLMYRSGQVANVTSVTICENDEFSYVPTDNPPMVHKIAKWSNRGKVIGYYIIIDRKDGWRAFSRPWSKEEVEEHRQRYCQDREKKMTPAWQKSFDVMAFKTVLRDMFRWQPVSTEMLALSSLDERTVNVALPSPGMEIGELLAASTENNALEGELIPAKDAERVEMSLPAEGGQQAHEPVLSENGDLIDPVTGEVVDTFAGDEQPPLL